MNIWKFNKTPLNSQRVKEEIAKEVRENLAMNESLACGSISVLKGGSKNGARGECSAYIKEKEVN